MIRSLLRRLAKFTLIKLIGKGPLLKLIPVTARLGELTPEELIVSSYSTAYIHEHLVLKLAYNKIGILNYQNEVVSGEHFLMHSVLPKYISVNQQTVLFDVGANIGDYSNELAQVFPYANVYAFEPNPITFEKLRVNTVGKNIRPIQAGLGAETKECEIYTYANDLESQHASIYKGVFNDLHNNHDLVASTFSMITLDQFCQTQGIQTIDFLKIDIEGNEMETLRGATWLLKEGKIKIIQFEFNEMNVISRVFLKDFYDILSNYFIYRINTNHLMSLFDYNSYNEIFKFQNFVAIHKTLPSY